MLNPSTHSSSTNASPALQSDKVIEWDVLGIMSYNVRISSRRSNRGSHMVWIAVLIAAIGVLISLSGPRIWGATAAKRRPSGHFLLLGLAVIAFLYGVLLVVYYWSWIAANAGLLILGGGLLLAMIAGMVVSVLSANVKAKRPLLNVSAPQLVYPMLFSPIVFYPIWTLNNGAAGSTLFLVYAAFVNGYFWERIVSDAVPVK
jgi:hypothetical protein